MIDEEVLKEWKAAVSEQADDMGQQPQHQCACSDMPTKDDVIEVGGRYLLHEDLVRIENEWISRGLIR